MKYRVQKVVLDVDTPERNTVGFFKVLDFRVGDASGGDAASESLDEGGVRGDGGGGRGRGGGGWVGDG